MPADKIKAQSLARGKLNVKNRTRISIWNDSAAADAGAYLGVCISR